MRRFMQDEHGATSIEYALIAGGISIAILSAVQLVGSQVMSTFYDGLTHLF
ncbi:MAG TPA: Flp family type IVb pilin [Pseudolabrys sp.]|nr:Flp family type IVb pilin [Pseudolabrys sp.]